MNDPAIVLRARDISRAFPGVQALSGVELTLRAGEVHALMGQNGAGKSTLIKVLTGVHAPDAGSIELLGKTVTPQSPIHAQSLGISAVHQESHLLPNLSVAENICAGRYPRRPWTRGGGIDWRETERRAAELLAGLGINLDVAQLAGPLPAALQQLATVARAVSTDARVLILDEPTSSLDADEVEALFALIRRLRDKGVAILFVTYAAIAQARIPVGFGASLTIGGLIALAVVAIAMRIAHSSEFGRTVYAIGGGESSARLMGLAVDSTKIGVYLLSGVCAALGGIVMTFYMLSGYSLHAVGLELDAIAAVVIGGTLLAGGVGYVAGTLFGVLILGIIQTLIAFDGSLSSWWTKIVVGALLLLFCLLQRLFEGRMPKSAQGTA